jgi:hypothetical protein
MLELSLELKILMLEILGFRVTLPPKETTKGE